MKHVTAAPPLDGGHGSHSDASIVCLYTLLLLSDRLNTRDHQTTNESIPPHLVPTPETGAPEYSPAQRAPCSKTSCLFSMSAKDTVRSNKTALVDILCGDRRRILDKVYEKKLITAREYNNLKSINKEDVEGHIVELVDKIMNKGEDHCWDFLNLLQTDEDIKATYPELKNIQLNHTSPLPMLVQTCSDDQSPVSKRRKEDEQYQLSSRPTGLCLIINNETFMVSKNRTGTNKDAQSLAEVFSWLGFRVLMCKDQTKDQMGRALKCFASLNDLSQLREFSVQEWTGIRFADLKVAPEHGDAFICCVLSHGEKGAVLGCDGESLSIKEITRTFKATDQSALSGKPKVFLIQACQGGKMQAGVLLSDNLEADGSLSIPEEADVLVAMATVEDHKALRHTIDGSWFVQSVCQQLKEGCPRGDDINTILYRVNNEVGLKDAFIDGCPVKQMPEVRFTLRKRLVLSPHCN